MTPYKVRVYEQLRTLYNKRLAYTPTSKIVTIMEQGYYRTYRALIALERDGVIQRPSSHGGWRPTPMAAACYGIMLRIYRRSHTSVSTSNIASQLNKNSRIIRSHMVKLERASIVQRPSPSGGWLPIRNTPPTVREQIIETLQALYHREQDRIHTVAIALELGVSPKCAREHLVHFEERGIVQRIGQRGGWLPLIA